MNLDQIQAEGFILALFIRDDGQRFLLGSGAYQFVQDQLHFTANSFANDVVEVQGNDGVYFAGQVRRANTQTFDGYIGDATTTREDIEAYRRQFFTFFRKNHYYTVVYVFNNGSAIKRQKGFIVDAPEVKELYQIYPQYHVAVNFEDVNYYQYHENSQGEEMYGKSANVPLSTGASAGGLVWDLITPQINGEAHQAHYSGKNLLKVVGTSSNGLITTEQNGELVVSGTASDNWAFATQEFTTNLPAGEYTVSITSPLTHSVDVRFYFTDNTDQTFAIGSGSLYSNFTTSKTANKVVVLFGGLTNGSTYSERIRLQLEKGEDQTWFEPYSGGSYSPNPSFSESVTTVTGQHDMIVNDNGTVQTYTVDLDSVELLKIGSAMDYIYKSGNDWYIHKEIGEYTFTGSESGAISETTADYTEVHFSGQYGTLASSTQQPTISTKFAYTSDNRVDVSGSGSNNEWYIRIPSSYNVTTVAGAQALVAGNTTYYVLDTPTDTQITDASLISDLNTWATALASLLGGVEWDNIGAVWESGSSGGPTVISIDSIDRVYPVWQVTGPAVNPQIEVIETNTSITYTGTVSNGEVLVVDMLNKTALVNGVSMISNISGSWLFLNPGDNRVTYVADNTSATPSKLMWQEIVG